MTTLATHPLDPETAATVALVADGWTPLGRVRAEDFRAVCLRVAMQNGGYVEVGKVSALMQELFPGHNCRSYSARWKPACEENGFLDVVPDELRPLNAQVSRGNGSKQSPLRKWRNWND